MKHIAYIALGSNMGNRLENIKKGVQNIQLNEAIHVVNVSSIYETDPVGYEEQDAFLNMVIEAKTDLSPIELLNTCLEIEIKLGRKRDIRWGPRTIDLDILLYNQEDIKLENLTIPHPRMHERAFVLIPLLEMCPSIKIPPMNILLQAFLDDLSDREGVRVWKKKNGEGVFELFGN